MLAILGFDREYVSAKGSYLYDASGRAYLDMHSGEGFASLGHNHPGVREVLEATLAADLVDGVQIHFSSLSGILAEELSSRLPRGLDAMFFCSAGAEAVDAAMKFTRAATRRQKFVSCESSFHGVTLGPLSLVGDDFFKEGFGPLLPGCRRVPFGDLDRLESALRKRDVAAFIVEPVQGRMVTMPPPGYLQGAQELCRRYGTLFVLDEIQTRPPGGLGRWFAGEHSGPPALEPDVVLVGKALSGGYMPVAAMATTREIFQRAVGTLERSYVHQSTYGRNRLSMAAGVAAIRIIERDGLVENAARMGAYLTDGLNELRDRYEMVGDVRGTGLMLGIELVAPHDRRARLNWRLIHLASEGLFPQLVVIPLHRDHGVITMAAGKNDVIKLLPPLTLSQTEAGQFLGALDSVLADTSASSTQNWGVVRDIATATLRRRLSRGDDALEATPFRGTPVDHDRGEVCLLTGATGFIGGPPRAAAGRRRLPGPLHRATEQQHGAARRPRGRARDRRPDVDALARTCGQGLRLRAALRGARLGLGDHRGDHRDQHGWDPRPGERVGRGRDRQAVPAPQHYRCLRAPGPGRDRRELHRDPVRQLVRRNQARRRARGETRGRAAPRA